MLSEARFCGVAGVELWSSSRYSLLYRGFSSSAPKVPNRAVRADFRSAFFSATRWLSDFLLGALTESLLAVVVVSLPPSSVLPSLAPNDSFEETRFFLLEAKRPKPGRTTTSAPVTSSSSLAVSGTVLVSIVVGLMVASPFVSCTSSSSALLILIVLRNDEDLVGLPRPNLMGPCVTGSVRRRICISLLVLLVWYQH